MTRLKNNPNDLKDKVAAMTELLAVGAQIPDISEAVSMDEFMGMYTILTFHSLFSFFP
jgi:hypothetical protein